MRLQRRLTTGGAVLAALATAGAGLVGLVGPERATAAPAATSYRATFVAPTRLDGRAVVASRAVGISDAGVVAGNATTGHDTYIDENLPFAGDGRSSRWLPRAASGRASDGRVTAVGPTGLVGGRARDTGGAPTGLAPVWSPAGRLSLADTGAASDDSAVVAGFTAAGTAVVTRQGRRSCAAVTTVRRGVVRKIATPIGYCEVRGVTARGAVAGTLSAPAMPASGVFPRSVLYTTDRTIDLARGERSVTDAVSPNGRTIVGRVGVDVDGNGGGLAFLTLARGPRALSGATGLVAQDADDAGRVVGAAGERAVLWQGGRLSDLTAQTRGLPRGWVLTSAVGLDARGGIAANARHPATGLPAAVKLTAAR